MKEHDPASPSSLTSPRFGHRARVRERVLAGGLEAMSACDQLELLLCYALPRGDVRGLARELLAGTSLGGLLTRPSDELLSLPGIGPHTASLLGLVARLHRELLSERERERELLDDPCDLVPWFRAAIGLSEEERFAAVFLDQGRQILAREVFPGGSRTRTVLYPRSLFAKALRWKATGVVIAHNHPGGSCLPSPQDRDLTRRVQEIGDSLEVRLLDHLLVTRESHASFRERGWL